MYAIPSLRTALSTSPRAIILGRALPQTLAYIAAVEAADGQQLENEVLRAMVEFANYRIPLGGAAVAMIGARTLAGALIPIVGPAPTNFNFVSADYNRRTGLICTVNTKRLSTNRAGNVDPQNARHVAAFRQERFSDHTAIANGFGSGATACYWGAGGVDFFPMISSQQAATGSSIVTSAAMGFWGQNRTASNSVQIKAGNAALQVQPIISQTPSATVLEVFRLPGNNSDTGLRLSYYSFGPSLDLDLSAAMVTALVDRIAQVLP